LIAKRKIKAMKSLVILLSVGLIFSCGTKKNAEEETNETLNLKPMQLTSSIGSFPEKNDQTTINSAKIEGNNLILEVSYGGGCEEHDFSLVGSQMISKSLPPIRAVKLIHDAHEDKCKAFIMKTLTFDISNMAYKQERGSEIMLKIEGVEEKLKYTFE
jgi:hypothetical protein